jgi:hypothetical protein
MILYGLVGYHSAGYDDEYINIRVIERFGLGAIGIIQNFDVHPPGSYLANWLLYSVQHDWHLVRLAVALFSAGSVVYAIDHIRKIHGSRSGVIAFLLVGLNPALLMWCTSLRWYAFFVPILIWVSVTPNVCGWRYWGKCFGGLVLLGYFSYAVFIVSIPLLVLYWRDCPDKVSSKLKGIAVFSSVAGLLYLYQFRIFLTVSLDRIDSQTSSLSKSLMGYAVAQIGNQGVFPLSPAGILSAIGTLGILFLVFRFSVKENLRGNRYFLPYWLGVAALILSGLAGKFRNFIVLTPWQGFWVSTARIETTKGAMFRVFVTLIAVGNLVGMVNVVTHRGTTKNSWNLPVYEVMAAVAAEVAPCDHDLLVLTHDPTFSYVLESVGFRVLSPYASHEMDQSAFEQTHRCLLVLKTYAGSLDDTLIDHLYDDLDLLDYRERTTQSFGYDRFHRLKRFLESRYPEYQVEMIKYLEVGHLFGLKHWGRGRLHH